MGRHREFDPDAALDAALAVFWRQGYEGTSFSDLTEATGVARPGLYATFGNKEALFVKAVDRYQHKHLGYMREALDEPTALAVAERILRGSAELHTMPGCPQGCLGVNGVAACSPEAEPVRQELVRRRAEGEEALRLRLERAKAEGDLADGIDPEALARYVMTVAQGMAVQAKAGVGRDQLQAMVDVALIPLRPE